MGAKVDCLAGIYKDVAHVRWLMQRPTGGLMQKLGWRQQSSNYDEGTKCTDSGPLPGAWWTQQALTKQHLEHGRRFGTESRRLGGCISAHPLKLGVHLVTPQILQDMN